MSDGRLDYAAMWKTYRHDLSTGERAALSRPDSLQELIDEEGAMVCRILRKMGVKPTPKRLRQYARVLWFFPMVIHAEGEGKRDIGRLLREVRNATVDHMCDLEEDSDETLAIFHSALRTARSKSAAGKLFADWNELGKRLFYWGEKVRNRIRTEYHCACV